MIITPEQLKEYFINYTQLERVYVLQVHLHNFNSGDVFLREGNKLSAVSAVSDETRTHVYPSDRIITIESETESVQRLLNEYD
jgi:hypothetical protein